MELFAPIGAQVMILPSDHGISALAAGISGLRPRISSTMESHLPRNATPQDIADYLVGGYNDSTGIPYTRFDPDARGPIKADIGGLTAQGQQLARWAMEAWESVADVEFRVVSRGADLTFQDHRGGAHADPKAGPDGLITEAAINVSSSWIDKYGSGVDSYTFRTYMHEIGHVLGLGHTGPYNGGADYRDAIFANDSWQLSVMSYLGQDENPNIEASRASNVMPMPADLLAIRALWGAPKEHYADGDTIWGIGSNIDNYLGEMFRGMADHAASDAYDLQPISFYIEDHGGHDRIDFSHSGLHQTVDLRPGATSSVLSFSNNMHTSKDTLIEDFFSGDGNDRIIGNAAGNEIRGGGRDDLIRGLAGKDSLHGDDGSDRLVGGGGGDELRGGGHEDVLKGQRGADRLWGGEGGDRLIGGGGGDRLFGGDHGDRLLGQGGRDRLAGEAGGDRLFGGAGKDHLDGGDGGDRLDGGGGRDRLDGGGQSDVLSGGRGGDHLDGGDGGDLLDGQGGHDRIFGGTGADELFGGIGRDSLDGGDQGDVLKGGGGKDHLDGGEMGDLLDGGAGHDTLIGGGGGDRLSGGNGNDGLDGGDGSDRLDGQNGDDRLIGGTGADELFGGTGDDHLDGGEMGDLLEGRAGHDTLIGDGGGDRMIGGGGNDRLEGGAQSDTLDGGDGDDLLTGGDGGDRLDGQAGDDRLFGGAGIDQLRGGEGNDRLEGGEMGDVLRGEAGEDHLLGGDGLDLLFGDAGDDRLDGGLAPDSLTGGDGADTFVFAAGYGTDTITDFTVGEDRIELHADLMAGLTAQGAADLAREADGKLVLNFGTGRLMLEGVGEEALSADSFILV